MNEEMNPTELNFFFYRFSANELVIWIICVHTYYVIFIRQLDNVSVVVWKEIMLIFLRFEKILLRVEIFCFLGHFLIGWLDSIFFLINRLWAFQLFIIIKIWFSFCVCFFSCIFWMYYSCIFLCFLTNYYIVLKKRKERLSDG